MRACENCHFCNLIRPSDISIADFWSWEKAAPGFNNDNKGASLVICNTNKGLELFDKCKSDVTYLNIDINKCIQPNMIEPSKEHPLRDTFENEYISKGFNYVYFKYGDDGWHYKIRPMVVAKKVKRGVRKILRYLGIWTQIQN